MSNSLLTENGLNVSYLLRLIKKNKFVILLPSLLLSVILFTIVYYAVPKFEGRSLLSPGYVKYTTTQRIMKDYFMSATDLQVLLQHEYMDPDDLPEGISLGDITVVKYATQVVSLSIYGFSESEIKRFFDQVKKKILQITPEERAKFKELASRTIDGKDTSSDDSEYVLDMELVEPKVLADLKVVKSKFRKKSFYVEIGIFLFILSALIIVFFLILIEQRKSLKL